MASAPVHPRAVRTRQALLAAGLDLLAARPIDAIAIDEVVARAGVAKGSFFNHFADKHAFAGAIGAQIRAELEARVGAANAGEADPIERLAGGMRTALEFGLDAPKQAAIMLRSLDFSTVRHHQLNRGIVTDIEAAIQAGLLRREAEASGMRYWLGLCQVALMNLVERSLSRADAAERLREMVVLGLTGLGVDEARARATADNAARRLASG